MQKKKVKFYFCGSIRGGRQLADDYQKIIDLYQHLRELADQYNKVQIERIRNDTSKTRLSLLYYAIVGNCLMLTKQNIKLLEIFNESFQLDKRLSDSYFEFDA